jgi:RHS repeat-associated protein
MWGGSTFTYDLNGNVTGNGGDTYAWNARDELANINGGATASFAYDGVRRRRGRTIGSTTTGFLYDGVNPVEERTSGTVSATWLGGLELDQVFMRTDSGGSVALLTDAAWSTLALADSVGTVQTEYTYEPFGVAAATGASTPNSTQYTGRENEGAGLYFYRARYYDGRRQRFLSQDPIGFAGQDINLYAYVGNDPVNRVDPLGLCPACAAAVGAVAESAAVRAAWSALLAALTAAAEAAANWRTNEAACERQYAEDVRRCNQCEPSAKRECFKQAMERYNACRKGKQVPPLFPNEPWRR